VQIDGQAIVAATPTPKAADAAKPSATPSTEPAIADLPPIKTALVGTASSFTPIWKNRIFWALQSIPLLLLGTLLWPKIAAALAPNTSEAQRLQLLREKNELATALRSADPVIFFPAAARSIEIEKILHGTEFSGDEAETVREIFSRRDEIAYGGGRGGRELSTEALRRYQGVLTSRSK